MPRPSLPPFFDIPKLIRPSVPETVDTWFNYPRGGAHGVKVAYGVSATPKVYGQDISERAATLGQRSTYLKQDNLTRDIITSLWRVSRGRQLRVISISHENRFSLPFLRDQLFFEIPIPCLILEPSGPIPLCVQARKDPPVTHEQYGFIGGLLRLAVDRTPLIGADVEICDISAPDGVNREKNIFRLSSIKLMSEDELNDRLTILVEAYDVLCNMRLPEKRPRQRKSPEGQDEFKF